MEPGRQIFWNIDNRAVLTTWSLLVAVSFLVAIVLRLYCRKGGPSGGRFRVSPWYVMKIVLTFNGMGLGHLPTRMHRFLFYGFMSLVMATVLVGLENHLGLSILRGKFYLGFMLVVNVAGVALLVGLGIAAYIRYIKRAGRLESRAEDALVLALPALIVLSGFVLQGLRLLATQSLWQGWAPVGFLAAQVCKWFIAPETARPLHFIIWHVHVAMAMVFMALLPWTKLTHILALPTYFFYRRPDNDKNHLEKPQGQLAAGTATLSELPLEARLEVDACMRCGRCQKLCPIQIGGIPFTPMTLLQEEKHLLHTGAPKKALLGSAITEEALWSCTACRSCEERCPMSGDFVERIVSIRRSQITAGNLPEALAKRFKTPFISSSSSANPLRKEYKTSDIYIWPGCHTKEGEGSEILLALVEVIKLGGLSPIVLEPPRCCSGINRLLGNESLFENDSKTNMAYLQPIKEATIVTPCPHCYTTLKYEYPSNLNVKHHTQFLRELQTKHLLPSITPTACKVTYHDPCFMGRYHMDFEAPREILRSLPELELLEMTKTRKKSPCCGSGGGAVMTDSANKNARNVVQQAFETSATLLITSCPYCRENLRNAGGMVVKDIAELLIRLNNKIAFD